MRCGRGRVTLFFPLHNSNFLYQIENVVCYPFRTANLVDNGTKEGQIGEGCEAGGGAGEAGGGAEEVAAGRPWEFCTRPRRVDTRRQVAHAHAGVQLLLVKSWQVARLQTICTSPAPHMGK